MNIETNQRDDHQMAITVRVDPQTVEGAKRRAARLISKRTKIPGFRPGKAPYPVVERVVGEAALIEEALESLIESLYPQVIDESAVQPYGPGSLENFELEPEPVFEFLVPLAPEVVLGDYRAVRIPYESPEITEEDVQESLDRLQHGQAIIEPVERPAQEGDVIFVTLTAELSAPPEGVDKQLIAEERLNVLIDPDASQDEEEWPFPGFARRLVGMQAGQDAQFDYTYPEDYSPEHLQSAEAQFNVQVEEVKSRSLPDIDDEFAQQLGDYETLGDLKDYIREALEQQSQDEYQAEYDHSIIEAIKSEATLSYPPQLLEREIEEVQRQLENRLAQQGLDLETYRRTRGLDEEGLRSDLRPTAEERVHRGLILMQVAEEEHVQVDQEAVQQEASRTIDQLFQIMPKHEARKRLSGGVIEDLVGQIMGDKMASQTMDLLRRIARGEVEAAEAAQEEAPEEPASQLEESATDTAPDTPIEDAQEEDPASPQEQAENTEPVAGVAGEA